MNDLSTKKVIIAEDEKPLAMAMQLKLQKEGVNVEVVDNGAELLARLEQDHFDLIITDLVMPKVDGFTVLEECQTRGYNTPIIVTSNLSQEEDKAKALALGAREYLVKSNTHIVEVIERIKQALV